MRLIDADKLHYNRIRIAHSDGIIGGYNAVVMSAEIKDAPTVDAVPVDKAISSIQEMIESIDEDFPLLDFNSKYMMERGMRMSLLQIKKLITGGERKGGDEL